MLDRHVERSAARFPRSCPPPRCASAQKEFGAGVTLRGSEPSGVISAVRAESRGGVLLPSYSEGRGDSSAELSQDPELRVYV